MGLHGIPPIPPACSFTGGDDPIQTLYANMSAFGQDPRSTSQPINTGQARWKGSQTKGTLIFKFTEGPTERFGPVSLLCYRMMQKIVLSQSPLQEHGNGVHPSHSISLHLTPHLKNLRNDMRLQGRHGNPGCLVLHCWCRLLYAWGLHRVYAACTSLL